MTSDYSEISAKLKKYVDESRKELLESFPKIATEEWSNLGFIVHCLTYGERRVAIKADAIIQNPTRCACCYDAMIREELGTVQQHCCWFSYFPIIKDFDSVE